MPNELPKIGHNFTDGTGRWIRDKLQGRVNEKLAEENPMEEGVYEDNRSLTLADVDALDNNDLQAIHSYLLDQEEDWELNDETDVVDAIYAAAKTQVDIRKRALRLSPVVMPRISAAKPLILDEDYFSADKGTFITSAPASSIPKTTSTPPKKTKTEIFLVTAIGVASLAGIAMLGVASPIYMGIIALLSLGLVIHKIRQERAKSNWDKAIITLGILSLVVSALFLLAIYVPAIASAIPFLKTILVTEGFVLATAGVNLTNLVITAVAPIPVQAATVAPTPDLPAKHGMSSRDLVRSFEEASHPDLAQNAKPAFPDAKLPLPRSAPIDIVGPAASSAQTSPIGSVGSASSLHSPNIGTPLASPSSVSIVNTQDWTNSRTSDVAKDTVPHSFGRGRQSEIS